MTVVLRPLLSQDIEAATQCGVAAWISSIALLLEKFESEDLSKIEQAFHYFFLAHLMESDKSKNLLIVATEQDQVAGFYNLDCDAGELTDLWVPRQWQGQGVAAQLMQHAIARSVEVGCHTLKLEVQRGNARAIAFYHKQGFVEFGRKRQQDPILECMVEKIEMRLSLGQAPLLDTAS